MQMDQIKLKHIISFLVGISASALPLYLPVFAKDLGANFSTIGAITAIYALTSGISFYYFGRFSDLKAIRKVLIAAGLFFLFAGGALHYFANSISSLFLIRGLHGIAIGMYAGPMIAYISSDGGNLRKSVSHFLSFSALGWAAGSIAGGYAANYFSYNFIFLLSSVPFLAAFIASLSIEQEKISSISVPFLPFGLIRKNLKVYLAFLTRNITAHAIWSLFTVYILSLKGGSPALIALILGINPLVQFFIMNYIPKMKYSSAALVKIGLIVSTFAFFTIAFSPDAYYLILSMALIGVSWSFLYTGVNIYLLERNPERATVSGLLQSTISIAMLVGPLIGGVLSDLFGMKEMILIVSIISLFALAGEFLFRDKF